MAEEDPPSLTRTANLDVWFYILPGDEEKKEAAANVVANMISEVTKCNFGF
jgi:hypothetical protein